MKPLLAPLACGALVAGLLYGLLAAAERKIPEPEDPWLDGWIGDGMRAEFRALSADPEKDVMPADVREFFKRDKPEGTVARNYLVQNTSTQVVRMAKPGLIPEIPEGRSLEYRFRTKGNTVNICRSGRTIVFVAMQGKWIPLIGQTKTSRKQVHEIFDSFEETVRRYP